MSDFWTVAILGVIGFISILGCMLLSIVVMAYRAQAPNKGYVSDVEQVAFIIGGLLLGVALVGLLFGWYALTTSLTFLAIFCSIIVGFGLT